MSKLELVRTDRSTGRRFHCDMRYWKTVGGAEDVKGSIITSDSVKILMDSGTYYVPVEALGGDVGEVEAAKALGEAMAGPGIRVEIGSEGRALFWSERRGFYVVDGEAVMGLLGKGSFMFSSIRQPCHVEGGRLVAMLEAMKPSYRREEMSSLGRVLEVKEYKGFKYAMITVERRGYGEDLLKGMESVVEDKLEVYGFNICKRLRSPSGTGEIVATIDESLKSCDGVIVAGGIGRGPDDNVLEAVSCNYRTLFYGIPMKPNVNTLLAYDGDKPIVCVPSRIASFPNDNSLDVLLPPLSAGLRLDLDGILNMWNGGLKEGWIAKLEKVRR